MSHHVRRREDMGSGGPEVQPGSLGHCDHPGVVRVEDVATVLALADGAAPPVDAVRMHDIRPQPQLRVGDVVRSALPSLPTAGGHARRDLEAPNLQSRVARVHASLKIVGVDGCGHWKSKDGAAQTKVLSATATLEATVICLCFTEQCSVVDLSVFLR